jgi:cytochrome c oxidase subunit II
LNIGRYPHLKIWLIALAMTIVTFGGSFVAGAADSEIVIKITARKFEYSPKDISIKKGIPVILEFISLDRLHGFYCPGLGIRTDIEPQKVNRLRFIPAKTGIYAFHCDNFCGGGHENMTGTITVTE